MDRFEIAKLGRKINSLLRENEWCSTPEIDELMEQYKAARLENAMEVLHAGFSVSTLDRPEKYRL